MEGNRNKVVLSVALALIMHGLSEAKETPAPDFERIPAVRERSDETVYADVMAHSVEKPFGDHHGRSTNVHETAHGIHATFRNEFSKQLRKRVNAFYMLDGNIAIVEEPDFLIRNVQKHVPPPLRGYRYKLYFVDQLRDWDDRPLYIMDEWTAYICGAESAVSDLETKGIKDDADAVSGALEFSVYAVAAYLTARERAPDYLAEKPQMKSVIHYNLSRAEAAFYAGRDVFASKKQDQFYEDLQSHPDAEEIRECLREEFGKMFLER